MFQYFIKSKKSPNFRFGTFVFFMTKNNENPVLPTCSVKACTKYQFLEKTDEQCRSLCIQRPGTAGFYVLHVTRNSTKS